MIYLDHAATTPIDPRVLEAMLPYLGERFGNPGGLYATGRVARDAMEDAREMAAVFLGCRPQEIIFTSGGSEADNLALRGVIQASPRHTGLHLITSSIEHHAVLRTAEALSLTGVDVTFLVPDRYGVVHPEQVRTALRPETVLVSVMHGNNEVGALQPVAEIGALCRERGVLFHTDAVQTAGCVPINVRRMPCDLLSLSGHKLYGPKGIGLLYRRMGIPLQPQITGGDQEHALRAGTENVAGIIGLGKALELAQAVMNDEASRVSELRDRIITGVLAGIPTAELTGPIADRLPNHASFVFEGIEGEPLLLNLDRLEICASSGAACASGSIEPSHVLLAMGMSPSRARGALRLTLGRGTTAAEIDQVVRDLPGLVDSLRSLGIPRL